MPDMLPTHQTNDQTKQLQNDDIIRHNNGSLLDIMQLDNETIRNIILREKELKTSQTALQALAVAPGNPAGNYMFKVNNRNTRTRCGICSKLTYFTPCSSVSIVKFQQANTCWEVMYFIIRDIFHLHG